MKPIHKLLSCVLAIAAAMSLNSCDNHEIDNSSFNGTRWFAPYSTHVAGRPDLIYIDTWDRSPKPATGRLLDISENGVATLYELDENNKIIRKCFETDEYRVQSGQLRLFSKIENKHNKGYNIIDKNTISDHTVDPIYYEYPKRNFNIDNDATTIHTRTFKPLSDFIK